MATVGTNESSLPISSRLLAAALMTSVMWLAPLRATAATQGPHLYPYVTTNKGCLETGAAATFAVGEHVIVFLRVGSSNVSYANATLFSFKPDGNTTIFGLGTIVTNATIGFAARVGQPEGVHVLQLKASSGYTTKRDTCSFNVVAASTPTPRPPTRTPTGTKTPKPTRTPTVVGSTTPSTGLRPHVTTNRGCQETGDAPTFFVGEPVTVSYGVDSDTFDFAQVTLFDIVPGGFVNVLRNRTVETNVTASFKAAVAPPTGVETLKLRASAYGIPSVSSLCSFTVVYAPARTRTPTRTASPTKTRTATRTPTRTGTSTPTATATPP